MSGVAVERLRAEDIAEMQEANRLFADVFGEEGYHGRPPGEEHLRRLLADDKFIALVARDEGVWSAPSQPMSC